MLVCFDTSHVSHTWYESSNPAGGEDDAAQLLSNEHALARNNMGMVPEHGTPLAQQNINVGRPPSTGTYPQVCMLPTVMTLKKWLKYAQGVLDLQRLHASIMLDTHNFSLLRMSSCFGHLWPTKHGSDGSCNTEVGSVIIMCNATAAHDWPFG